MIGADPLGAPLRQQGVAVGIVAERRDVVDVHAAVHDQPRQVDGAVERVATRPEREGLVVAVTQLDHAFAERGEPQGCRHHVAGNRVAGNRSR